MALGVGVGRAARRPWGRVDVRTGAGWAPAAHQEVELVRALRVTVDRFHRSQVLVRGQSLSERRRSCFHVYLRELGNHSRSNMVVNLPFSAGSPFGGSRFFGTVGDEARWRFALPHLFARRGPTPSGEGGSERGLGL